MAAELFGLLHLHPVYVAFAFVVGLWLGAVAWRAGSVWPAVLCHAAVNAALCCWTLGARFGLIPDPLPDAAAGAGVVVLLACFLAAVWFLARRPVARPVDEAGGAILPPATPIPVEDDRD